MSFPSYYQAEDVGRLYVERGGIVAAEAERMRQKDQPAAQGNMRVAAFGIDAQVGFCHPDASLFVPGAVEDTRRTIEWIYRNVSVLTKLVFSLDTHEVHQLFHPAWWVDEAGQHPAPLTVISSDDVASGRWRALREPEASLAYCQQLEAAGRYQLTIWPYHTLLGGTSHALVPALMEAALFHSLMCDVPTEFVMKGRHPQTENYSVFSPEVTRVLDKSLGGFNDALFQELMSFDRVYVFGQASSHCVLSTLRDMLERIQRVEPSWADKIWILRDAMSPVPAPPIEPLPPALDFPAIAEEALREFAEAGMHVTTTDAPIV
jgi:nicotinamidase-related amidase